MHFFSPTYFKLQKGSLPLLSKLEYLAVYGRASMAVFRHDTWSKVWPWILIWAYL